MSRSRSFRILAIPALLAACGGTPAAAQPVAPNLYEVAPEQRPVQEAPQEAGIVEVTGSASVGVTPDRAVVSFAVETREDEAGAASEANAELMDRVIRALRAADLPGLTVETFGYTLRPEYTMVAGEGGIRSRVIDGYTALNNIRVTISDVNGAGRVIDLGIGAGANRVSGLGFMASDTREARREVLAMAVEEARAQATAMANALGHELGKALEVRGGAATPRPQPDAVLMRAEAAAAPTPIEAGEQTVTAAVTITFALGPARGGR